MKLYRFNTSLGIDDKWLDVANIILKYPKSLMKVFIDYIDDLSLALSLVGLLTIEHVDVT